MVIKTSMKYLSCPMCDADIPVSGDERVGEEIYCPYCRVPLGIRKKKDAEELYLEENF